MPSRNVAYAILGVAPLRYIDLIAAEAHNLRTISVVGIDPAAKANPPMPRGNGLSLPNEVMRRIRESGAKEPGTNRAYAFEAVLTCSPEAEPMPTIEEITVRGLASADRMFGKDNVVAAYPHADEKTPHLHIVAVPICYGPTPGRPRRGGETEEEEWRPIVSWNQFCGAAEVDYRSDDHRRNRKRKGSKTKKRDNPVMSGWQTEWARTMADYGLRRGVSSSRDHLPIRWIRGQHAKIVGQADASWQGVRDAVAGFVLSPAELAEFSKCPTADWVRDLAARRLLPKIEEWLRPVVELGARGIQLEVERQARADLADANELLRGKLEALESGAPLKRLEEENAQLRAENARVSQARVDATASTGEDYVATMSDADFDVMVRTERARRGQDRHEPAMRPLPNPQSVPNPNLEPGK